MTQDTSVAARHAAEVTAQRARIDSARQGTEAARTRELAESEAYALAQIRIRTEREAAQQAETLLEAERKAELAAIQRHGADLEAAKEARRRQELDEAARLALQARTKADQEAEESATRKRVALEQAALAAAARRQTWREAAAAKRARHKARLAMLWAYVRATSPLAAAAFALLTGLLAGHLLAAGNSGVADITTGGESSLRLETQLTHLPRPGA